MSEMEIPLAPGPQQLLHQLERRNKTKWGLPHEVPFVAVWSTDRETVQQALQAAQNALDSEINHSPGYTASSGSEARQARRERIARLRELRHTLEDALTTE